MTTSRSIRVLTAVAALALTLTACGSDTSTAGASDSTAKCIEGATNCIDTFGDEPMVDPAQGGIGSSCVAGDSACTDESGGGQDATRFVDKTEERSGATQIARGATVGATGHFIERAAVLDGETTLELTFTGGSCDLVEDVLVQESDTEVRLLVLAAPDASVEVCTADAVAWAIDVTLNAPLGGRAIVDLADSDYEG